MVSSQRIGIGMVWTSVKSASPAKTMTGSGTARPRRICASESEEPYSSKTGQGFENRIGEILAKAMGRTPEFVWYERPAIYLVRDQLNTNECDLVIGLDTNDERVATSKPYYRAPYIFVQRKDSPLDIKDWDFHWHERYQFREPLRLPRGTVIQVEVYYDNSADNPKNPNNPPRLVKYGNNLTDEMVSCHLEVVAQSRADLDALLKTRAK